MIEPEKRKAIFLLHQEGMSVREIARRLGVSRNAVRSIVQQGGALPASTRKAKVEIDPDLLRQLYDECDGRKQRIHEKLTEEKKIEVTYPTLTRLLRRQGIGLEAKARCEHVGDTPGAEMQHDTTVYSIKLGERPVRLVASLLYLRYSKRRYLKFSPVFNRFRMKCFFHEGLTHWGYAAGKCIIDNTNLARLRGTGKEAVIVPEMEAFAKQYGFQFVCHEKGHANRKAGEERSFWTVETNFLPGRTFQTLEDLNLQALQWATVRLYHRPVAKTGLIPAKAFELEQEHLVKLPPHLPGPYLVHDRVIDEYGHVALDGNYYWVPGTGRGAVRVLEYAERMQIYRGRELLAEYRLPPYGVKNQRLSPEGLPKPPYQPKNRKKPTMEEEKRLRAMGEAVAQYLDAPFTPKGAARHRFVRELFSLSREASPALFLHSIERALKYRIDRVETVRRIALLYLSAGMEAPLSAEVDESFTGRDAYLEGYLTDEPDFSHYDRLEESNG